jgi:hypothetical protein
MCGKKLTRRLLVHLTRLISTALHRAEQSRAGKLKAAQKTNYMAHGDSKV